MARLNTNYLLESIEEGLIDRDTVILACLSYMSEDDVTDMCRMNGFFIDEDEEEDEEED